MDEFTRPIPKSACELQQATADMLGEVSFRDDSHRAHDLAVELTDIEYVRFELQPGRSGEGAGRVAFDAGCRAGLAERGFCFVVGEGVVAGGAADDVEEGGAGVSGPVGQVLEGP